MATALEVKFEQEVTFLQKLQNEINTASTNRQQLEAQLQENTLVKQELDLIKSDTRVYKQVGPILVKQDGNEAKQNVEKRIEFISNEIKRLEKTITEQEQTLEKRRLEAMKLQQQLQQSR